MSTAFANEFIPYNVSQLSGIQLWLDAADSSSMTLSGSTVTAWRDKSGLSNNATINNSVTFNASDKSVRTDGTNGYFTSPLDTRKTTSTYYNVFIVYKWLSSSSNTNQSLWGNDVGGGWNRFQLLSFPDVTSIAYGLSRGSASPNTVNISALNTSNTLLYSANYAYNITNGSFAYVNGSQAINFTEVAAQQETTTQLIFFGQLGSDQYFASIAFHEIIVARLEISNTTRQAIEGYLAWKWGLQNNLPSTHPYALSPFYAFPPFPITNKVPYARNRQVFLPTQISGCMLWLDGADPNNTGNSPANGATISTWTDKSGNSRNATTGAGTLTYSASRRAIAFNGTSYYSLPNNTFPTGNNPYSIIVVASSTLADFNWIIGGGVTTGGQAVGLIYYANGSIENGWWSTNIVTSSGIVTANQAGIIISTYDSTTLTTFFNGTSRANSSSLGSRNSPAGPNIIGARIDSTSGSVLQGLVGNIHEILVFSSALSSLQQQQIEGYLAWKWGLQGFLASSHAYKQAPTYTLPPFPSVPAVIMGTAKPYDPTKVSGCQVWLDAADRNSLTVSNSVVTLVKNKVDNSSLTPSGSSTSSLTLANSSIGKLQSLFFNNLSTYNVWLQGSFGNISTGSSFVVWKALSQKVMPQWSPFFTWYSKSGSTYGSYPAFGYLGGTTNLTIGPYTTFASPNGTPTTQLTADTNYLGFYGWSNTTTSVGLNGATPTSGTQPSFSGSTTTFLIGQDGDINGPADAWAATNMNLGEILIFNRTITSIERQEIEGYLAWKWGLQGSLPQTHPWKLFPPPPN